MPEVCHRCGGDLPSTDGVTAFCPHCGAPQLYLSESYLADRGTDGGDSSTTGALPPPMPRAIDWQTALRCSALVALIAGVLFVASLRVPFFSLLRTIWVLTASISTLALYQRRRPAARMDAGIGVRIGLASGLTLIAVLAASMAAAGVVARFGLHAMAGFDADFAMMIAQAKQKALSSGNPVPDELLRLYDRPEFQAGIALVTLAFSGALLLLFSIFGGALGGMLGARRRAVR